MILGRCDTHARLKSGAEFTVRGGYTLGAPRFSPYHVLGSARLLAPGFWLLAPSSVGHGTKRRRLHLIGVFR
jgi:hypothetical protein